MMQQQLNKQLLSFAIDEMWPINNATTATATDCEWTVADDDGSNITWRA